MSWMEKPTDKTVLCSWECTDPEPKTREIVWDWPSLYACVCQFCGLICLWQSCPWNLSWLWEIYSACWVALPSFDAREGLGPASVWWVMICCCAWEACPMICCYLWEACPFLNAVRGEEEGKGIDGRQEEGTTGGGCGWYLKQTRSKQTNKKLNIVNAYCFYFISLTMNVVLNCIIIAPKFHIFWWYHRKPLLEKGYSSITVDSVSVNILLIFN